jgi:hypothetical protein
MILKLRVGGTVAVDRDTRIPGVLILVFKVGEVSSRIWSQTRSR